MSENTFYFHTTLKFRLVREFGEKLPFPNCGILKVDPGLKKEAKK